MGLGASITTFAAHVQDWLRLKGIPVTENSAAAAAGANAALLTPSAASASASRINSTEPGRMIAVIGDAELDEGNVFECLMESSKHDMRNNWYVRAKETEIMIF